MTRAAFQDARRTLLAELGIEPSHELRRLQGRILRDDPSLAACPRPALAARARAPMPGRLETAGQRTAPCQLPPTVADFAGRDELVARVNELLSHKPTALAPALVILSGVAGVGKTTVALHVAHRLRAAFPDGQLFVNCAGSSPHPHHAGELLVRLLRATGPACPAADDVVVSAAVYRSWLADRRALMIVDDAASSEQIRPLLPGVAGSAVIITSRHRLSGIAGAHFLDVEPPTAAEAIHLLRRIVGDHRVDAEPQAAQSIVHACGRLPLALRIAGGRLCAHPTWPLSKLAARLADERHRLDELVADDLTVRPALASTYTALAPRPRQTVRLLAVLGPHAIPSWTVGAILGRECCDRDIDTLVDAHLLEVADPCQPGQLSYRMPDLIRLYVSERAPHDDHDQHGREALGRVLGAWLHLAETAAAHIHPADTPLRLDCGAPRWRLPLDLTAQILADPHRWYRAERPNLLRAIDLAYRLRLHPVVTELATALTPFFLLTSEWQAWHRVQHIALKSAQRSGDPHAQAYAQRCLADIAENHSCYRQALPLYEQCVPVLERLGDRLALAYARLGRAACLRGLSRLTEARGEVDRCITEFHALDDQHGHARALCLLGQTARDQGHEHTALDACHRALHLNRALDEPLNEAQALQAMGLLHLPHPRQALRPLHAALDIACDLDHKPTQAYTLSALAAGYTALGRSTPVPHYRERALTLFEQLDDPYGLAILTGQPSPPQPVTATGP